MLQEKQDAIMLELLEIVREYREIRNRTLATLERAYAALRFAEAEIGPSRLASIASVSPARLTVSIRYRSVVGARVPVIQAEAVEGGRPPYAFADTSHRLDIAVTEFEESLRMLLTLSEREAALRRLADEIKRTRRRVNALEYVLIPQLQAAVKYVDLYLDEREREDFFRLKRAKVLKERLGAESIGDVARGSATYS